MTQLNMTDYDAERAAFHWPRPEKFNFASTILDRLADTRPTAIGLWVVDDDGKETRRSFSELASRSRKLANVLTQAGVGRGDVVMVILGGDPGWWDVVTACHRLGAIVSPGTTQLTAKDISYRVDVANAKCLITNQANAEKGDAVRSNHAGLESLLVTGGPREGWIDLDAALDAAADTFETVDTDANEPSMCYFTSGTTGHPKMVLHTQASLGIGHEISGRYWLNLNADDVHWNVGDTGWAKAAYSSYFGPWRMGATVFVWNTARFTAEGVLSMLQQFPITSFCAAPTLYRGLVQTDLKQYALKLRQCFGAGEPLNPECIEAFRQGTGLQILEGYGQTETALLVATFQCIEFKPGSMGKAAPGYDVQVVNEQGQVVATGQEGQIAVRVKPNRPVGLFAEYWKNPKKNAESFIGDWYLTGDRACMDDDGYFFFISRDDDVIISSGYRIGPFEVESALIEHQAVMESAVVSSPDEARGEVVKAFIVLVPGCIASDELARELQDHVKSVTAPYKYPRKIEFVQDLPKTVSGKIRRIELREREWARAKG